MRLHAVAALPTLFILAFQSVAYSQRQPVCLPQNKPVTLSGRLEHVDERGYTEWIALTLPKPICALADPTNLLYGPVSGVTALQLFTSDDREALLTQLRRLLGKRVALTGQLTQWGTGYQRADLVLDVASVEPVDGAGRALLSLPVPPKPPLRDVAQYDVTVRAGRRLSIEAHETGTGARLEPPQEYLPHWMTGGEVVYVDCREGYVRKLVSTSAPLNICFEDDMCGFNAFPDKRLVMKFRCVRKSALGATPKNP